MSWLPFVTARHNLLLLMLNVGLLLVRGVVDVGSDVVAVVVVGGGFVAVVIVGGVVCCCCC